MKIVLGAVTSLLCFCLACSSSASPSPTPLAPAMTGAAQTPTPTNGEEAQASCDALLFRFTGEEWVGKKGARSRWWWDGKACVEQSEPFGLSGIPHTCEGPGCAALFESAEACAKAHAGCEGRSP